jgi:hypothetical protein
MVNGAGWKMGGLAAVGYGHRRVVNHVDRSGPHGAIVEGEGGFGAGISRRVDSRRVRLLQERVTDRAFVWHEQVLLLDRAALRPSQRHSLHL